MSKSFPLSKPITVIDGKETKELSEIALRDPTPDDWFEIGDPVTFVNYPDGGQRVEMDSQRIKKYIVKLCDKGVAAQLGQIEPADLREIPQWLSEKLMKAKN